MTEEPQEERFEATMRRNRLVFYEQDIEEINASLDKFLEASQARCVLLVDLEGHLVTSKGFIEGLDTTSIAALVAGSFASTREVARKLGETEFSVLFHQGANESIHVTLVSDRALAVILFDDRTTIGMVRLYAQQVADDLTTIFEDIGERQKAQKEAGNAPGLSKDFSSEADAQLDNLFSDNSDS
ncbi:MAG: roadblock/LC7 domain-containing protein [Planctomycetota bacterium]|jgi:predicted regulator of Ras-like GTPase activity (Roadblock/LC7/MglB family)